MSATAALGVRQIGTFLLYFLFIVFTIGFFTAFLSGVARDILQSLVGPISAFVAAYQIARTQVRRGCSSPTRTLQLRFSVLAAVTMFALVLIALGALVYSTGDGLAGLPVGDVLIGFPIIFVVTVASAYLGLAFGFRSQKDGDEAAV